MTENKYSYLAGQTFGQLKVLEVEEFKVFNNRTGHRVHLECKCGNVVSYPFSRLRRIRTGDQVSCGCVKKEKWRKGYYAFVNQLNKEFPTP